MRIALLTALYLGLTYNAAQGAEIKILTAGAFKPVVTALAPQFEQMTGHKLIIDNDTAGGLTKRIEAGEAFDVVFLPPAALGALANKGLVAAEGQANVARVGIGVAVKEGTPLPEIGTTDAFKAALQKAKAIAVIDPKAGGSSGIYLADLFQKWGMTDVLRPKLVLVPGGLVATRLVNDEADLALHQISEIIAVKGAKLVGPLPAEIQNFTVYRAGLAAKSGNREPAAAFITLMQSPAAKAILQEKGMEPPG
jgi:molybdate transport system substrate-binding protein